MRSVETCICVGAGGFWGQHVCHLLRDRYHVVSTTSKGEKGTAKGWVYFDATLPETVRNLPSQSDVIIFLVMSQHYKMFPQHAVEVWQTHVQGLLLMLEYARTAKVRHFVLASSGSVYAPAVTSLKESSELATGIEGNFYVHSKIAAEMLLNSYHNFFSTTSLRLFVPYGEGARSSMLMSFLADAVITGQQIYLQGEDGMVCTPVHIVDAAHALAQSLELQEGHSVINVAGSEIVTIGQLCRTMGSICGNKPNFVYEGASRSLVGDNSAMCSLLGCPQITLAQGLPRLVAWRQSLLLT